MFPSASDKRLTDRGDGGIGDRDRRRRAIGLGDAEHAVQFAGIEHRLHDVGATDELAVDIELRNRRPVAVFLDALADVLVGQHVDGRVVFEQRVQTIGRRRGKTALRRLARAFHEEHDAMRSEQTFDAGAGGGGERHGLGPAVGRA